MYTPRKYPRTLHLPQSLSVTSDDKVHQSTAQFNGVDVVITEKMDGENTTIHCDGTHARSVDGCSHPSCDWLKQFAAGISQQLDSSERICGEYLYARHSVEYIALPSYFLGFAWFVDDELQSWDDTLARFAQLGIISVPILYRGEYSDKKVEELVKSMDFKTQEGFVVRATDSIPADKFSSLVGKVVRENHVQTDKHWMHSEIVKNGVI